MGRSTDATRPLGAWLAPLCILLAPGVLVVTLAFAIGLALGPAATRARSAPDRIDLPAGWRPEGITTDGTSLFVGSLADGAVWRADPATGEGSILVEGTAGSVAVGLDVDLANSRLWVAGGPTGQVRAYDSTTGDLLATYAPGGGFLNDLVVTPAGVYVTDSFAPTIVVIAQPTDGTLPPADAVSMLALGGDYQHGDGFNVNGIVATDGWLVIVQSSTGEIFRVDATTGYAFTIDAPDLTNGDGLELAGDSLFVVRNQSNLVAQLAMGPWLGSADLVGELTSDSLDIPATAALVGTDLWAVNARFNTAAGPDTDYWITRLSVAQ